MSHRVIKLCLIGLIALVPSMSSLKVEAAGTSISPAIIANSYSPIDAGTQSTNRFDLNVTINANGNTDILNSQGTIFPVVSNMPPNSAAAPTTASETLLDQAQRFTFTSGNENLVVAFSNLPLLYPGQNYFTFVIVVFTPSGGLGGTLGGDTAPQAYTRSYSGVNFPVYRFYSSKFSNAHFFTQDSTEKTALVSNDNASSGGNWTYEGRAFDATALTNGACSSPQVPVARFYSSHFASHFYTSNTTEISKVASDPNWTFENNVYCADTSAVTGSSALYRFWSPKFNKHFFTSDASEMNNLIANDNSSNGGNWSYEGIAYYVQP